MTDSVMGSAPDLDGQETPAPGRSAAMAEGKIGFRFGVTGGVSGGGAMGGVTGGADVSGVPAVIHA